MTKLMKDVFESKEDGTIKAIGFPTYWSDEKCIAAYHAINSHDTLTEQNKQLVEALDMMITAWDESGINQGEHGDMWWCREVLAKHKGQI